MSKKNSGRPTADNFRAAMKSILSKAKRKGLSSVDVNAGELHRSLGYYPGANHKMPVCCYVMRSFMKEGDTILQQPPKGNGASVVIRYNL